MPTSLAGNLYPSVTDGKRHTAKHTKAQIHPLDPRRGCTMLILGKEMFN